MSRLRQIMIIGAMLAVGIAAGRAMGSWFPAEANSTLLLTVGIVAALVNATSFQVLRKLDEAPTRHLSQRGASRLRRIFDSRRRKFRLKWLGAIASGFLATICGGFLRAGELQVWQPVFTEVGYSALVITLWLGLLIVVEYTALSRLARDLPVRLDAQRAKAELLHRLQTLTETGSGQVSPPHRAK